MESEFITFPESDCPEAVFYKPAPDYEGKLQLYECRHRRDDKINGEWTSICLHIAKEGFAGKCRYMKPDD
jgi:hypothetical protein